MYNASTRSQVHQSLDLMSNALFDLMKERQFNKISVSELCLRAGVARRTFYRNVDEMADLLDWRIDQIMSELLHGTDFESKDAEMLYRNFFHFWMKYKQFLATLYSQRLFGRFDRRFVATMVGEQGYAFLNDFLDGRDEPDNYRLFFNAFIGGGLCTMLEYWTADGFSTPVDMLVDTLLHLVPNYST